MTEAKDDIKVRDFVDYHTGHITQKYNEVIDGPKDIGGALYFKIVGKRGYVPAAALTQPVEQPCPHCAHHRCGGECCWCKE